MTVMTWFTSWIVSTEKVLLVPGSVKELEQTKHGTSTRMVSKTPSKPAQVDKHESSRKLAIEIALPVAISLLLALGAILLWSRRRRRKNTRNAQHHRSIEKPPCYAEVVNTQAPRDVAEMEERVVLGELEALPAEMESPIAELHTPASKSMAAEEDREAQKIQS